MRIVPLGDKVVVQRLKADDKSAGGIVLPDTAKEKPHQGKVLSIGDGRMLETGKRMKPQVKDGDRVIFTAWAGTEVSIDGDLYIIMSEDDILAVID